jgi:hypothetical protein
MRRLSFRVVFFAFALFVQTMAGAIGASSVAVAGGVSFLPLCDGGSASENRLPVSPASHKHDCLACEACASGVTFPPSLNATSDSVFRAELRARFETSVPTAPRSLFARAHQARAPPLDFI